MTKNNFLAGNYNSVSFYQQLIYSLKSPGMQDTNDVPPLVKYNKCTHQRGDFCFISFMGSIHYLGFWKKDWLNCYIQEIKNAANCDLYHQVQSRMERKSWNMKEEINLVLEGTDKIKMRWSSLYAGYIQPGALPKWKIYNSPKCEIYHEYHRQ